MNASDKSGKEPPVSGKENDYFKSADYLVDRDWLIGPSLKIAVERVSGCKVYRHDPRLVIPPFLLVLAAIPGGVAFKHPSGITISLGLAGAALIVIAIAKFRYSYELMLLTPAGEQSFAHYADRAFVNRLASAIDKAVAHFAEQKKRVQRSAPGNISVNGFQHDKVLIEVDVGGRKQIVDLSNLGKLRAHIDVTSKVKFGEDGHPTFSSIHAVGKDILIGLRKTLGV